jgi:hypothetical protein
MAHANGHVNNLLKNVETKVLSDVGGPLPDIPLSPVEGDHFDDDFTPLTQQS